MGLFRRRLRPLSRQLCRCFILVILVAGLCLASLAPAAVHASSAEGAAPSCLAAAMTSWAGRSQVMVGAMMEDDIAAAARFDLRYVYIAGQFPDGGSPCSSCAANCTVQGRSCANTDSDCGWWGCWQDGRDTPGAFARQLIAKATASKQIPVFTYYTLLQASGVAEGKAEIAKAADVAFMRRYYDDFRFLLLQIGAARAIIHLEPDLWGYARQVNSNPEAIPAAVATANASDCGALPNTIAGMGQCLVRMVRTYAPGTKAGFHATAWNTSLNTRAGFDVDGDASATAHFLAGLGAADLVVVEADDRDAGYYQVVQGSNHWWDATDETLPNFSQMLRWVTTLTATLQKPALWWQVPVGNMALANVDLGWKDNRLDYFFAHMPDVARSNSFGIAYGAGAKGQTTPSTDGGLLMKKTQTYVAAGGTAVCQP